MPELPEVETIVRGLHQQLIGRKITGVDIFKPLVLKAKPAEFTKEVTGQTVVSVSRHGKSIFWTFQKGRHVKVHLGMTGALLFREKEKAVDPYVRVRFRLDDPTVDLVYRDVRQFGRIAMSERSSELHWGPDAWTSTDEEVFAAIRRKKGMIKHALMNQLVVAGLGNIYVDETLFLSGIHPKRRVETLSNALLKAVCGNIRTVLGNSINAGGTTFRDYMNSQGKKGEFKRQLNVYGQQKKPCPTCGSPIKKIVVASRGTHFCPKCQKAPRKK